MEPQITGIDNTFGNVSNTFNQENAAVPLDLTQVDWLQQMYDLDTVQWGGGENHYEGPHDDFCYLCGGHKNQLFECQTCDNCYHAKCMLPGLDALEVPNFWFCPHCVERNLHIPPVTSDTISSNTLSPPTTTGVETVGSLIPDAVDQIKINQSLAPTLVAKRRPRPSDADFTQTQPARGKSKTTERSFGTPRKKSKYSAFSSEVDKALSVLHAELETAAEIGKSEDSLRNKIEALEQHVKMQDGQLKIRDREFTFVRSQLVKSREEPDRLKAENEELKREVVRLGQLVGLKDTELRDWRTKLRTMLGSELE